jgi:hypothetical protein
MRLLATCVVTDLSTGSQPQGMISGKEHRSEKALCRASVCCRKNVAFVTVFLQATERKRKLTSQIRHYVIHHDESAWKAEPNEAFKHQRHKEGRGQHSEEHNKVCPCQLAKLVAVLLLLKSEHEQHNSCTSFTLVKCLTMQHCF